ncbi:hypothetical protein NDU88_002567 [Pleurodeles waltl]|uniref:Uncharacterized protein n=1 Tax=Pleurodeles waltl TaxID=8319 RepID=A0AAV7UXQ0_PLEWA|nr:hypothetical protein NDU88_002567 [Pleurodeles waltl]
MLPYTQMENQAKRQEIRLPMKSKAKSHPSDSEMYSPQSSVPCRSQESVLQTRVGSEVAPIAPTACRQNYVAGRRLSETRCDVAGTSVGETPSARREHAGYGGNTTQERARRLP